MRMKVDDERTEECKFDLRLTDRDLFIATVAPLALGADAHLPTADLADGE